MNISFDFDGTLNHPFGYKISGDINHQKDEICSLAKKYIHDGHSVFIITKRYGPEFSGLGLGNEHLEVYDLALRVGISRSNVHFTNREMKLEKIIYLKIDRHFDDEKYECDLISGSDVEVIPVYDPYWRDLVY